MNASWHRAHPMPKNATLEQRVRWHVSHAPACGCRAGASLTGLEDDHRKLMRSRAVGHPFGMIRQPLRLKNPAREALPKVAILCSFSLAQVQEMIAGLRGCASSRVRGGDSSSSPPGIGRCSRVPMTSPGCLTNSARADRTPLYGAAGLALKYAGRYWTIPNRLFWAVIFRK